MKEKTASLPQTTQAVVSGKLEYWVLETFSGSGSLHNKRSERGDLRWRASLNTRFEKGYVLQEGLRNIAGLPIIQLLEQTPEWISLKADMKPVANDQGKGWIAIGFSNFAGRPFWKNGVLWAKLRPDGKFVLLKDRNKTILKQGVAASFRKKDFNQVELQYRIDESVARLLINGEFAGGEEWIPAGELADFRFAGFQLQKGMPGSAALGNFSVFRPKQNRSSGVQVINTANGQVVQVGETVDLGFATSKNEFGLPELKSKVFSIRNQTGSDTCLSNFKVSQTNVFDLTPPPRDTPPSPCSGTTLIKFIGTTNLQVLGGSPNPSIEPYIGRVSWSGTNNGSFNFRVKVRVLKDRPAIRLTTDDGRIIANQGAFPFENTPVNQPLIQRFFIYNDGDERLSIQSFRVGGEAFTSSLQPSASIEPGRSTFFEVRLQSNTSGTKSGTITFNTNDPSDRTFRLNLTAQVGNNAGEPQIRITGAGGDVIPNGGEGPVFTRDTPRRSFTIFNDGNQALENVRVSINGNTFTVDPSPPSSIQNQADFSVRWNGAAATTAVISVFSNDPDDNPYRFNIRSQTGSPTGNPDIGVSFNGLEISQGEVIDYGETLINVPLNKFISVRNKGTDVLRINRIETDGGGFAATWAGGTITIPARQTKQVIDVSLNASAPREASLTFRLDTNVGNFEFTLTGSVVAPKPCEPSDTALCFYNGRFQANLKWRDPNGQWLDAKAQPLTNQSGAFYYQNSKNLEMLLKILDGGAINQNFWVFYGVLTDRETRLVVKDMFTNRTKTFTKPKGNLCGAAVINAFPSEGTTSNIAANENTRAGRIQNPENLELLAKRFQVKIDWRNPRNGSSGSGIATPYTDNSGFFWFFRPSNIEVLVKILNGKAINGHFWVFHGPMTDLEYAITVTDTVTNTIKTYDKASGSLYGGHDIKAFPV